MPNGGFCSVPVTDHHSMSVADHLSMSVTGHLAMPVGSVSAVDSYQYVSVEALAGLPSLDRPETLRGARFLVSGSRGEW